MGLVWEIIQADGVVYMKAQRVVLHVFFKECDVISYNY